MGASRSAVVCHYAAISFSTIAAIDPTDKANRVRRFLVVCARLMSLPPTNGACTSVMSDLTPVIYFGWIATDLSAYACHAAWALDTGGR